MNLVIVDYQYDFLDSIHGGALPVPDGWSILDPILEHAHKADRVFATRDWHPFNHNSFDTRSGPWPVHCVAGSSGAQIVRDIDSIAEVVFSKGTRLDSDGYSAAENPFFIPTLKASAIKRVKVVGLAFEFCVLYTALDLASAGFRVEIPTDASQGLTEKGVDEAIDKLKKNGVYLA